MARRHTPGAGDRRAGWAGAALLLASLFILALLIRLLIAQPFAIPSASMLPQLMIGDYVLVAKWPYGYSRANLGLGSGRVRARMPTRGDLIVFREPATNENWVKRVIGLPGDEVELRRGAVLLNGREVPRTRIADFTVPVSANSPCRGTVAGGARRIAGPRAEQLCAYRRYRETLAGGRSYEVIDQGTGTADDFGPVRVPAGHLFVLGDNRDDSRDSRLDERSGGIGMLDADRSVGRPLLIIYSEDGSGSLERPWSWTSAVRADRIGRSIQ